MADEPQDKPPLAARIEQNFGTGETSSPSQPCAKAGGGSGSTVPLKSGPQDSPRDLAAMNESHGNVAELPRKGPSSPEKVTVGTGLAHENPSELVQARVEELRTAIPENSRGRITMGIAVVEDASGNRSVLVSTSEPRGYLRPGLSLKPGETMVVGTGHAEADIVAHADANNLKVIDIGATRPVCAGCQSAIGPTGANVSTPLKK